MIKYFVALDESNKITDYVQLDIFIRRINAQFEVTKLVLSLCSMHGIIIYFSKCAT